MSTAGLSSGGEPIKATDPNDVPPLTEGGAPLTDSGPPTIAPVIDSGVDAEAGGPCGDASFCETFDQATPSPQWILTAANDAVHGVDALAALSPSKSLWAETNILGGGEKAYSYRYVRLAGGATRMLLTFSLLVEKRGVIAPPPSGELVVAGVGLEDAKGGYLAELLVGDARDAIKETRATTGESTQVHQLAKRIPIGKWVTVTIDVLRLGSVWGLSAKLDDAIVLSGHQLNLWSTTPDAKRVVSVGILSATGPATPWRVRIDDVTLH